MSSNDLRISQLEANVAKTMSRVSTKTAFQDRTLYNSTMDPSFNTTNTTNLVVANNAIINGSITVTGTTTTLNTTNLDVSDNIIGLNRGGPSRDSGIVIERTDASNVFIGWKDENFTFGKTNDNSSSPSVTVSSGTLHMNVVGDISGNATIGSTLDQRINTLDDKIEHILTNTDMSALDSLTEIVAAYQAGESALDASMTAVEGRASLLETHDSVLDASMSSVEGRASLLEAHDSVLDASMTAVEGRASLLETHDSVLDASVNALDNSMNAVFTDLATEKSRAEGAEQALDASMNAVFTDFALTSYVDTKVSDLVNSAPGTLDTLNELAAALGDDANFSTTILSTIGDISTNLATEKSRAERAEQTLDASMAAVELRAADLETHDGVLDFSMNAINSFVNALDASTNALEATKANLSGAVFTGEVDISGGLKISGQQVSSSADDINKIYNVTNGTASANKALVVDLSKDIGGLNQITANNFVGDLCGNAITAFDARNDMCGNQIDTTYYTISDANDALTLKADVSGAMLENVTVTTNLNISGGFEIMGTPVNSNAAQLNTLTVTEGTVKAFKALVVDSSKDISGINQITASNFIGDISGNATSATQLETPRNIGGVNFDGTSNIALPGVNADVSNSIVSPTMTPLFIGEFFVDTSSGDLYFATATDSSNNWVKLANAP